MVGTVIEAHQGSRKTVLCVLDQWTIDCPASGCAALSGLHVRHAAEQGQRDQRQRECRQTSLNLLFKGSGATSYSSFIVLSTWSRCRHSAQRLGQQRRSWRCARIDQRHAAERSAIVTVLAQRQTAAGAPRGRPHRASQNDQPCRRPRPWHRSGSSRRLPPQESRSAIHPPGRLPLQRAL